MTKQGVSIEPAYLAKLNALRQAALARAKELGVACIVCEDTGRIKPHESEICHCAAGQEILRQRAEQRRQAWYGPGAAREIGVPGRLATATLDTFPDQNSPALAQVRAWLEHPKRKPGLMLIGPAGRGKTGLMTAALMELCRAYAAERDYMLEPRQVGAMVVSTALFDRLRDWDEADRTMLHLQNVPYLAIDDLGTERITEWGADRMFELINARYADERPILVTSNLDADQIAARIDSVAMPSGERIVSRLTQMCRAIAFPAAAPDWRLANA